jgi:hypothetical protein
LELVPEPLPVPATTIKIFSLGSLQWLDERGRRQSCGPHGIHALPVAAAKIALKRNLAYTLNDSRYLSMRETAKKVGWPHLADPTTIVDLDRDPNTVEIYSSGGKKLRDEIPFDTKFQNYRENEPARKVWLDGDP